MFRKPYALILFLLVFAIRSPLFAAKSENVSKEAPAGAVEVKAVPSDFEINMQWGPRMPGQGRMQSLLINSNGDVVAASYLVGKLNESLNQMKKNYKLSSEEISAIYQAVIENNFFGLKDKYENIMVSGGTICFWGVGANGQKKIVWAANKRIPELTNITRKIKVILSAKDKSLEFPVDY